MKSWYWDEEVAYLCETEDNEYSECTEYVDNPMEESKAVELRQGYVPREVADDDLPW